MLTHTRPRAPLDLEKFEEMDFSTSSSRFDLMKKYAHGFEKIEND